MCKVLSYLKYVLWGCNAICFFVGLGVIYYGTIVHEGSKFLNQFLDDHLNLFSIILMVIGSIIVVASLYGLFALIMSSTQLLNAYAFGRSLILILLITVGILALTTQPYFESSIEQQMLLWYSNFRTYKEKIEKLQLGKLCCGFNGSTDWEMENLPVSCCGHKDVGIRRGEPIICTQDEAYEIGCTGHLEQELDAHLTSIGTNILVIGGFEAFCIALVWIVICNWESEAKKAREARRARRRARRAHRKAHHKKRPTAERTPAPGESGTVPDQEFKSTSISETERRHSKRHSKHHSHSSHIQEEGAT